MELEWLNTVGKCEDYQPCTMRAWFFIRLENGQEAQIAAARITFNPFPRIGECAHAATSVDFSRPGIKYPTEESAYRDAVFAAGRWVESHEARTKQIRQ